ncbi:tetratricopeptide repeat protein [Saccharothrix variisporea]|uniref:tetratricopeptide repeat protein n=1 Tax=Saccharothrix variisporea TaxID=543527 RepID=UPI0011C3DCA6|nr:tetratricopeptide repeat protein [Saccharothrix variisporea]
MIYDNVNAPEDLTDLHPPAGGRVLVTARDSAIAHLVPSPIKVAEFQRRESIDLLQRRSALLNERDADQLADALGDLPLAVEQAGCFLSDVGLTVASYLALLDAEPLDAGLGDPTIDRHPGLAAVVSAGRRHAEQRFAAAAGLLDRLSLCAPEPFPVVLEGDSPQGDFGVVLGDTATTVPLLRTLGRLALVDRIGNSLQIHRLVQLLVRATMTPQDCGRVASEAMRMIGEADPGNPDSPASWAAFAALTPHVQALVDNMSASSAADFDEPERFRAFRLRVCRYLHAVGQYEAARHLATNALSRWPSRLGRDHPDVLMAAHNLGRELRALGDYGEARELNADNLTRMKRVSAPMTSEPWPPPAASHTPCAICGNSRRPGL